MSTHPQIERLSEFADGGLDTSERRRVERHLAACAACRSELDALDSLRAAATALPDSIEPERDLWAGIAARMTPAEGELQLATRSATQPGAAASLWRYRYPLAAAAVLLVALGSFGTLVLVDRGESAPVAQQAPAAATAALDVRPVADVDFPGRQDYQFAIGALSAMLEQRADELDPATVETVERNLRIVDAAIREALTALAADPGNGELTRTVAETYRTKMQILTRAVELPAAT